MARKISLFWFRRDLRLHDNHGLFAALRSGHPVLPLFIFDKNILDQLEEKDDARVNFIYEVIKRLRKQLEKPGSTLEVRYGTPLSVLEDLVKEYSIKSVFANHDYEPYARERDNEIENFLNEKGIGFKTFKDQVIFERSEVVKDNGEPYTIFTPYSKKWLALLGENHLACFDSARWSKNFLIQESRPLPSLEGMGFELRKLSISSVVDQDIIRNYHQTRDIPSLPGTTRLGIHLRFGTISIRELVRTAKQLNETFLKELIWREFFMQMLWHHPHLVQKACKPGYDKIRWRNNEKEFQLWCSGNTGYPIVDAGMRELNETGFMHNRVRMITASFLVKHLLIDWRWGEAYFATKLLDYELASNNGNWQWVAGCGCDAMPWFRIFNPSTQTRRFDPKNNYIKKWVPEWGTASYPEPVVEHEFARERCIKAYNQALGRTQYQP